jgi:Tfp pilus assembly protein PilF
MHKLLPLVAAVCVLIACSQASQRSSAKRRADRLNASKTEARELMDAGLYAEAVAVLEPLSREASGDPQVFVMLGDSYGELGRADDAVGSYESAIRLSYTDYLAHMKLANVLMERGKTGRALTEYELAARMGGADPVTHYNYGLALYERGWIDRALEEWRAAFELEGGNPKYAERPRIWGRREPDSTTTTGSPCSGRATTRPPPGNSSGPWTSIRGAKRTGSIWPPRT